MELRDMTKTQLYRLFFRIKGQLYDGGHFGWDWRTLHSVYPSKYHLMRSIAWEHDRK